MNGSFNTLVAALQAAGLEETLKGDGPFTVFAPTDEAFAKLPAGTVDNLLLVENRDQLISILTYHVVAGEVTSAEVLKLSSATTVNGQDVQIRTQDGAVMINGATVLDRASIFLMTMGSSMLAMMYTSPPHSLQVSISMPDCRRMGATHCEYRAQRSP